jgi:hypothetical protein
MKKLFMIGLLFIAGTIGLLFIAGTVDAQDLPKNLTKSERKFVNNVISLTNDVLVEVTKRNDGIIVVEFYNTMYTLNEFGYIDEMWILEDEDWVSLGREY